MQTSGITKVRMGVRRFAVERPGRYRLQIAIPPGRDVSRYSAVFSKAFLGAGFLAIFVILAGVGLTAFGLLGRL